MVKALLLDCGGVLVKPATGDWVLSPVHAQVLGEAFATERLDDFRRERRRFLPLLPDANVVTDDGTEYTMFVEYFRQAFAALDMPLAQDALESLAHAQVYRDDRYVLFDDVLPYLDRWRGRYKLGIVSDAPPSTRRIMDAMGVSARMDGATYSCELGVLKPGAAIYRSTLDRIGASPQEAVFVDDVPGNLHGAQALGIRAVQMRRPMPPRFAMPPAWDGPVVHDLAELDALLAALA